jgi:hypothetical protein
MQIQISLFISLEIDCFHSQWTRKVGNICIAGQNRRAGFATDYIIFIVVANNRFVKIFGPTWQGSSSHEEFSRRLRVTFKWFVFIPILNLLWEVFSFQVQL